MERDAGNKPPLRILPQVDSTHFCLELGDYSWCHNRHRDTRGQDETFEKRLGSKIFGAVR